jgi:outer membrane autotransporter protein
VDGNSTVAPNGAKVDVYQLIGYGSHSLDADTEANFQVGVGKNRNRGHRDLPAFGLRASASYDSTVFTAGAGLGRSFALSDKTRFTPSVRADYTWIKDDGYTETGAGALNLNVRGRKTDELILAVDGKLTHELSEGTTLTANLGVGYDVLSKQASITAAFAGAPGVAFTTQGLDPSPWLVRGGLGIVSKTKSGMEITARYDVEHRSHFLNQTASVKLRWAF